MADGGAAGEGYRAAATAQDNDGVSQRETLKRPTCHKCSRAWQWPRNLAYVDEDPQLPKHIEPSTKETVVALRTGLPRMNEAIFKHLEVTDTRGTKDGCPNINTLVKHFDNTLVKHFEYHNDPPPQSQDGYVRYDPPSQSQDGYVYARLVTLNTWYIALHECLISVALAVLDQYANFTMALALYTDRVQSEEFHTTKHVFLVGWLGMIVISLIFASHLARREWRIQASPDVGDLIEHCNWVGQLKTYLAMVFFTFFAVENTIKDVVIRLHPWKSIQPFAAIKVNGARAFAIGYKDKCLYRVENRTGQFYPLLITQVLKSGIFSFKVYISIWFPDPVRIASSASSVFSLVLGWWVWRRLRSDRRKLRQILEGIIQREPNAGAGETPEAWRKHKKVAEKLLSLHFGQFRKKEEDKDMPRVEEERCCWRCCRTLPKDSTGTAVNKCECCGRDIPTEGSTAKATGSNPTKVQPYEPKWPRQPHKGDMVKLAEGFEKYHDAKRGPMPRDGVGRIVEVGAEIAHIGGRCLVEVDTCDPPKQYWYDDDAIQLLDPVGHAKAMSSTPTKQDPTRAATTIAKDDTDGALMRELEDLLERMQERPPESQQRFGRTLSLASNTMLKESSALSASHTSAGDLASTGCSPVEESLENIFDISGSIK